MAKLLTGTRVYGTANVDNVLTVGNIAPVDSTSNNTGSLVVFGGVGISGNTWSSGKITVGNSINIANINNIVNTSATIAINAYRAINLIDTNAVVKIARLGGDAGIELQSWDSTGTTSNSYYDFVAVNSASTSFSIRDRRAGGSATRFTIANTGEINIPSTTVSTSNITGALTVSGGVGILGNTYTGNLIISGSSAAGNGITFADGTRQTTAATGGGNSGVDASQNVRIDYSNTAITIIQGVDSGQNANIAIIQGIDISQNANIAIIQGVDSGQNANIALIQSVDISQNVRLNFSNTRMDISDGVNASQNVRIDYSNTVITIIQGVDSGQNANIAIIQGVDSGQNSRMTVIEGTDVSQNVRLNFSNTRMDISDGVDNSQNVRIDFSNTAITIIQGVDATQNTRLTVIEGTDASQNVRLNFSNTRMDISDGVDASQNVRIDFSNTAITATDGKMQSAFNRANTGPTGFLANSVIFSNTSGFLANTGNIQFFAANNTFVSTNIKTPGLVTLTNTASSNTGSLVFNASANSIDFIFT
jgi:hypothetical protein